MQIIRAALPIGYNKSLDYIDDSLGVVIGDLLTLDFRGKEVFGICTEISVKSDLPLEKIKKILQKHDLRLNHNFIKFLKRAAEYNMISFGEAVKLAIGSFDKKLFDPVKGNLENDHYFPNLKKLNETQVSAFDYISQESARTILLEGVTGSGKTEVYFHLIWQTLQQNKQVLLLLPEIGLTTQIIERFTRAFGTMPVVWHSGLTDKQKRDALLKIITKKSNIIIGTRSSLFLPYPDLAMVIVDEEHDQSYKQEEGAIYHARNMAVLLGVYQNIKIILGSATPAIETMLNAQNGKYGYFKLGNLYSNIEKINIRTIDLSTEKMYSSEMISPSMQNMMYKTLEQANQVLLFLNRRGFAPLMLCKKCGNRIVCKNCSTWMVFHKAISKLNCHHCSHAIDIPASCTSCGASDSLITSGPGIEKLEEEVRQKFPLSRIININTDNIKNYKEIELIFNSIHNGEYDIIIGTQMIGKGLDFPKLTMVGIVDADFSLGGDLRAMEKNYQAIKQVLGRGGRHLPGIAAIQTYNPKQVVLDAITHNDHDEFYKREIGQRKEYNMPPFSRMISLLVSATNENLLKESLEKISNNIKYDPNVEFMGPMPAILYKLRGRYRWRIIFKSPLHFNLQHFVQNVLLITKIPVQVRVKIDVDPYDFS